MSRMIAVGFFSCNVLALPIQRHESLILRRILLLFVLIIDCVMFDVLRLINTFSLYCEGLIYLLRNAVEVGASAD